ncbi:NEDD8 ultimate buster 1 isoform X1 [Tripterygium wilfordii]|uniref:NEDD8 ultimate buster 1 isoform X1 n=1 Tax=Tripterygium wilfordii TaxID=458696 RepID=A0A7J7BVC5_TRIWF|nr:NEDD8 ultimate buster 1 [Tripterygium wilfordii]KAF5725852.1 NEDD8 ultimate buster 1 isoform X1 [Tripterygium wilfordii]
MAKLKIAGTWAGVLEVELENWTVPMLREEVAKRSNLGPESINLICAGKLLKDGDGSEKLSQLGIKNNGKILASRVSVNEGKSLNEELMAEEERSRRLNRVKAAASALAQRHADGLMPVEDFNIELEDQSGQKVQLGSETDQRAIMMGLMLHTNAKQLIRRKMFKDALEVLTMGEEAFSLCNPKAIELIDNVSILQIDMVWCYFMLRDVSWLSVAGIRLQKAKEGLERAHGKDASRVRLLQAGRSLELALHMRLELLEGVVAYHSGQFVESRKALTSAQAKFSQLVVSDEALSLVMSMGFKEKEAKRALRMSNQDVGSAIDFLVEERTQIEKKREEDIRRRDEISEQKQYGVTPLKKPVDLQRLRELVSIGFDKELAAEALRRNENDTQKALDDLTSPETNSLLQVDIESRKRKRQQQKADAIIERLVSMGFDRSRVVEAVRAGGNLRQALQLLTAQPGVNPSAAAGNNASSAPTSTTNLGPESLSNHNLPDSLIENDEAGEASTSRKTEVRDEEMENELAAELERGDAYSDYDFEVTEEGEALNEYLALLDSAGSNQKVQASH